MIANPNDGNSPRVEAATPIIDVSAEGLITATTEQEAGYVPGGTKSATQQLTTQGAKTVTPGTTTQTAVASGRYTTGAVQVAGDANLKAENIAEGVSIFGIEGTLKGSSPIFMGYQTLNTSPVDIDIPSNTNVVIGSISAAVPFDQPDVFLFVRGYASTYNLMAQTSVDWNTNRLSFLNGDGKTVQYVCFE